MIESMKKFAAGALVACAFCLAAASGTAWAAAAPAVGLAPGETGSVSVSIAAPEGTEDVRALKIELELKGAREAGASAAFAFDPSLGADVREARTPVVNGEQRVHLYVASKDRALLANADQALGTLSLASADGAPVEVSVVGLEAVNAAHDAMDAIDLGIELPEALAVQTRAEGGEAPNPPDGEGDEGGSGDGGSGDGGDGGEAGTGPGDQNVSPGAPTGTASPFVSTGDGLLPLAGAFAVLAALAGLVALAVRGCTRARG